MSAKLGMRLGDGVQKPIAPVLRTDQVLSLAGGRKGARCFTGLSVAGVTDAFADVEPGSDQRLLARGWCFKGSPENGHTFPGSARGRGLECHGDQHMRLRVESLASRANRRARS